MEIDKNVENVFLPGPPVAGPANLKKGGCPAGPYRGAPAWSSRTGALREGWDPSGGEDGSGAAPPIDRDTTAAKNAAKNALTFRLNCL